MKLDKIDTKILKELDTNPKITTTQLAKRCLISQQVADYRLKNLQNNGIITKFTSIINYFKLGYFAYLLLLKSNPLSNTEKKELNEYVNKQSNIYSAKNTGGNYEYVITYLVKTYEELDTQLHNLFTTFDFFTDYAIYPITEMNYYPYKKFKTINSLKNISIDIIQDPIIETLDDLDIRILEEINEDCRKSNLEMGKKFKVNYNTIKNHIDALDKRKIISGHKIIINPQSQNLQQFNLLLSLEKYSPSEEKKLLSFCLHHEEIIYTHHLLGGIWTFNIGIETKSLETLQKIISEIRTTFKIIDEITVIPVFNNIRENVFSVKTDRK